MKWPLLARQQALWIPTIWGWIFILIAGIGALVVAGRQVHSFLAPNQPSGARLLVVEGWMSLGELDQAADVFRDGGYERMITTGAPTEIGADRLAAASYAELARDYLVARGLPATSVTAIPSPASAQDRTFLNAVMVREWLERTGTTAYALDIFSAGVHSRRSWALYRIAFGPQARIGIIAARPTDYDPETWWQSSPGAKTVLLETLSWIWTELFFQPPARGSHEEKWGGAQSTL